MNKDYATKKELEETKQELLDKIDTRVSKDEFHNEIKRLDGSIEILANQVGKNTQEIRKLSGDVTGLRGEMNQRFSEIDDRFDQVDNKFNQMDDKFNMVLTAIDGLSGQISDSRTEKAAGEHTFRRHEQRLDDHDLRIEKIERKIG